MVAGDEVAAIDAPVGGDLPQWPTPVLLGNRVPSMNETADSLFSDYPRSAAWISRQPGRAREIPVKCHVISTRHGVLPYDH